MGTAKALMLVCIAFLAICASVSCAEERTKMENMDYSKLQAVLEDRYPSIQWKRLNLKGREILVALGTLPTGVYSTETQIFVWAEGAWHRVIERAFVLEKVDVVADGDRLVARTDSGRVLFIVPSEGLD